jgi:hypothetical protein
MKKIIRKVNDTTVQVTVADERWYFFESEDPKTKLPLYEYDPSVTWIAGFYPKGVEFYKWLANKGWDESQAIKQAAGDKGSKVHYAITDLLNGVEVKMDSKYRNPSTELLEMLSLEEWECLMAFAKWHQEVQPLTLANEIVVRNKEIGYAGTVDYICEIDGQVYLIDFKTGQHVWSEYALQISAYKHALDLSQPEFAGIGQNDIKLAILQIGYKRNKNGYKFTEMNDKFDLFLAARQIWDHEVSQKQPKAKDLPMSIKLTGLTPTK